ncbi:hypothetical protein RJ639_042656 [Escallonia herrerae]|uniref:DUF7903 domain-containing protein n=1 Tax=Escallonia herrerae TaxID=1293975 RepID=A0AA88WHI7_9ASTE|nr:hypothetical protein RJ639_042656 [Escallonia herrerae]
MTLCRAGAAYSEANFRLEFWVYILQLSMAYIPPHKRHSKDSESSSPTPESIIPQFKRNLNPKSFNVEKRKNKYSLQGGKIIYGNDAIDRWFTVGLGDEIEFSSATCLKPVSLESIERKQGEKPLALVLSDRVKEENKEVTEIFLNSPWNFVAENVKQDLLSAFEKVKNEIESQEVEEIPDSTKMKAKGLDSINRGGSARWGVDGP